MTTDSNSKSESICTEAPASWNTSYITPEGFVCRITLRGDNGRDLLEKATIALAFLLENGFLPAEQKPNHGADNKGNICPLHGCEMKHYEREGRTWYSHRLQDGSWCRGRKQ